MTRARETVTGLGIVMATSFVAATIAMEAHVTWTAARHRAVDGLVVGGTQSGLDTSCRVPKICSRSKERTSFVSQFKRI